MKTELFQSCGHHRVFQIYWHIECSTFTASSIRIWYSSIEIPSPLLALFIVMLPKAHLTSHSRMSGSRWVWVITPLWLSGSWRSFLHSFSVFLATSSLFIYFIIFFYLSTLVEGYFLDNIVVVFAIHWYESAMDLHVRPILNPPPTSLPIPSLWVIPVHQPRTVVSCIKPGLVICFTIDNMHVSMLFSQIIHPSPSPTESRSLFYISVSLFMSCIYGYHYHLSKFHIYVLVYCNGLYLSGLLHSV